MHQDQVEFMQGMRKSISLTHHMNKQKKEKRYHHCNRYRKNNWTKYKILLPENPQRDRDGKHFFSLTKKIYEKPPANVRQTVTHIHTPEVKTKQKCLFSLLIQH